MGFHKLSYFIIVILHFNAEDINLEFGKINGIQDNQFGTFHIQGEIINVISQIGGFQNTSEIVTINCDNLTIPIGNWK